MRTSQPLNRSNQDYVRQNLRHLHADDGSWKLPHGDPLRTHGSDWYCVQHFVIEAAPEKLDQLSASDKAIGVIEEAFRNDDHPSGFGRINATVREAKASDDLNAPYETIDEGEDLSEKFARMHLSAHGFNDAGFAYRGDHQNSNTFSAAALQAGELPPATGVARDPAGSPGELLEFFAPGLNEPLRVPIGQHSSYEPARFPVRPEPQRYRRLAASNDPASISPQGPVLAIPAPPPDNAWKLAVPVLGKFIGGRLITPAEAAAPSRTMLTGPTAPNLSSQESALGDRPENATVGPMPVTYPRRRSVSAAFFPASLRLIRASRRQNPPRRLGSSAASRCCHGPFRRRSLACRIIPVRQAKATGSISPRALPPRTRRQRRCRSKPPAVSRYDIWAAGSPTNRKLQ
jgi:hypothetical protein